MILTSISEKRKIKEEESNEKRFRGGLIVSLELDATIAAQTEKGDICDMETTLKQIQSKGVTETGLKWIALVTMVMDHIHYFFGFTGGIPEWFSMVGRLGALLFLFCLVEGFTHTHNRKRYFAKVYIISVIMSALLFFMAYGGVFVRPDGFYPTNGIMTAFVILMVIWQGIDWLGEIKLFNGIVAVLFPLAWPFLASLLTIQFPALSSPLGFLCYSFVPMWGVTGDSSWPMLAMGLVLYLF